MADVWPCTTPHAQAAMPVFCPLPNAPEIVYFTDIESVSFTACPSGSVPTDWCKNGPSSAFGAFASSGVHSFWGYNRPSAGFISVSDVTPVSLPAGAKMQFNHSFGFQNTGTTYWDGGQIRYSTDNGMSAFVADSWGYTATQLDLSSLAGQDFRYQFYVGTDTVIDDYGWFVDDIHIYTCAECPATRMLDISYNGTSTLFKATTSITAGSGFEAGFDEAVTLQSPLVEIENFFEVVGDLTISNDPCPYGAPTPSSGIRTAHPSGTFRPRIPASSRCQVRYQFRTAMCVTAVGSRA